MKPAENVGIRSVAGEVRKHSGTYATGTNTGSARGSRGLTFPDASSVRRSGPPASSERIMPKHRRRRYWAKVRDSKGKKPTLYSSSEGKVCYGHKFGFEPDDTERPITEGCIRCAAKKVAAGG